MEGENGMGKGVVFGELCYAGKSQLDLEPLIDRAGEDAVSRAVYSTRLYFCISTAKDIVAGIQKVRIVVLLCRFRRAVGRSVISPFLAPLGITGPRGLSLSVGRSIGCRRSRGAAPCGVPDAR